MQAEKFLDIIDSEFFTGVPDSLLRGLCDCLMDRYGSGLGRHTIAANEGNSVAIAAGYYLSTGKIPVVYLQNSGEGNVVNPVASLLSDKVYSIPMLFIVGWRGEPGVHDEPQHIFQGEITTQLLDDLGIVYYVVDSSSTEEDIENQMTVFKKLFIEGKCAAFVIKKETLTYSKKLIYSNSYSMKREDVINQILNVSGTNPVIATTGKTGRELFELRVKRNEGHDCDFLTVGSMGHSSSIAFGIAISTPLEKVWCIDGDGAVLMHMGALAVIGSRKPNNLVHIVINNCSHESVGGLPTAIANVNLTGIALACGYEYVKSVDNLMALNDELKVLSQKKQLCFLEVKCAIGARADLGRPTDSAQENKEKFMKHLMDIVK